MSERRELTMIVSLDRLPESGHAFRIDAKDSERVALAERFDLVSLDRLEAEGRVDPLRDIDGVRVSGRLQADVVQNCVVTFEPVAARVDVPFEVVFARQSEQEAQAAIEIDPGPDDPEPLDSDEIDVGEIVAEELSLALDPYPRAPDAAHVLAEIEGQEDPDGPFAALGRLRVH